MARKRTSKIERAAEALYRRHEKLRTLKNKFGEEWRETINWHVLEESIRKSFIDDVKAVIKEYRAKEKIKKKITKMKKKLL